MGAFNTLYTTVQCDYCGKTFESGIQFKFGDTWQLLYKMGDTITWGGNEIGIPNLPKVRVLGCCEAENCPHCKKEVTRYDYDIFFQYDVITGIQVKDNLNEYLELEEDYIICNK